MDNILDQEFNDFLKEQKYNATKKAIFWISVVIAVTFSIMYGIFISFDAIAQGIVGML